MSNAPQNNNHNQNQNISVQSGFITISMADLLKIIGFVVGIGGVIITINKQITTLEIKQELLESQYQEVKKMTQVINAEMSVQKEVDRKDRERLQQQLHDLENTLSQIYQKVMTGKKWLS